LSQKESTTRILFLEHLEGNGVSLYTVLSARRKSGLMKRLTAKGVAKKCAMGAFANQVSFSRKTYANHAYQNTDALQQELVVN
jgi:hypothetical protein